MQNGYWIKYSYTCCIQKNNSQLLFPDAKSIAIFSSKFFSGCSIAINMFAMHIVLSSSTEMVTMAFDSNINHIMDMF